MAECIAYSSITVSGAGLASVNGVYVAAGTGTIGDVTFTVFSKDGNINSVPRLVVKRDNPVLNQYGWVFVANVPGFGNNDVYEINYVSPANLSNCPVGLTFKTTNGPWGSSTYLPAPTVAEYIPLIDPVTARNNKYATAIEAGSARFRRLHALGYV